MPDNLQPVHRFVDDVYYCAVKNEWEYHYVTEKYGRKNAKFGALYYTFHNTESEFIFSRAVARFQHLVIFEE